MANHRATEVEVGKAMVIIMNGEIILVKRRSSFSKDHLQSNA
jgi:hypothetical protein